MANLARSLGRNTDIPITSQRTLAALSAGNSNDPGVESTVFTVPQNAYFYDPTTLDNGIIGFAGRNDSRIRLAEIISEYTANVVASGSTNYTDYRLNVWRNGTFYGTLAYYSFDVATTTASVIQIPFSTTSSTAVTGGSTTSITVASATNIVIGTPALITGVSGADAGKTDYVTVSNVSGTTITLSAAPVNSYSTTFQFTAAVVNTTATTTVTSGSTTITPASMNGIVANEVLYIYGSGGTPEYVKVASVTTTTFTATFVNAHSGTYYITNYSNFAEVLANQGIIGGTYPSMFEVAVIPTSMTGIVPGQSLILNSAGTTQEQIVVKSLIGTIGFMANCSFSHQGATNETIKAGLIPYVPAPMIPAIGPNNVSSDTVIPGSGTSVVITPTLTVPYSIYGIHVGDWLQILGGGGYETALSATTVSGTSLTATFGQQHSGTTKVGYYVATTSSTAVTGGTTTAITVASATNIVAGMSLILKGTGADSAKTNTMTVQSVASTTVTFTAAIPTNSYSATINVTSVAYLSATTTTVANSPSQVVSMASTTGIAQGDLVLLQGLTGNSATAAFTGTPEVVYVEAVVANTSITITPHGVFTNAYAVVPFSKDSFTTAVTSTTTATTVTLATGSTSDNIFTGNVLYVWGGTGGQVDNFQVTAVGSGSTAYNFTAAPNFPHSGAYTIQPAGKMAVNNSLGYAPSNNTTFLNEPFTLLPGDTVTITRYSNNSTGLATQLADFVVDIAPSRS